MASRPSADKHRKLHSMIPEKLECRQLFVLTGADVRDALDLQSDITPDVSGNPSGLAVRINFTTGGLLGFPSGVDSDYLVMSTGRAVDIDSETIVNANHGTDIGDEGAAGDTTTISITLPVPASSQPQKLKFDFMFLSEEYDEFIGSSYNDTFTATVNGSNIAVDQAGNPVSVNNVLFTKAGAPGTYFDGRTDRLTATYNVSPGETSLTVVLTVADVGDGIYDSAVLVDNMRFEQRQVVWLNFEGQDVGPHFGPRTTTVIPRFETTDLKITETAEVPRSAVISDVVTTVASLFAAYDIDFTATQPASGEYETVVIGGTQNLTLSFAKLNPLNWRALYKLGTSTPTIAEYRHKVLGYPAGDVMLGRAQSIDFGNRLHTDKVVVFSAQHQHSDNVVDNIRNLAHTIAHELGHNVGLRHVSSFQHDLMESSGPVLPDASFTNVLHSLTEQNWPDQATQQNSDAYLRSILGAKAGGSSIVPSTGFDKFESTFIAGLSKPLYDVDLGIFGGDVGWSEAGGSGDDTLTTLHFDVLMPGQAVTLPFAGVGAKFFLMGASIEGGEVDTVSGKVSRGDLGEGGIFVPLHDEDGNLLTKFPMAKGSGPGTFKSAGSIELEASPFAGVAALPNGRATFVDADGDRYTIKLTGPGAVAVVLDDTNPQGGNFVKQIFVQDTDPKKSRLSVTVSKRSGGDGLVRIDQIAGSALSRITAGKADLAGAGIDLTGSLGRVTLHDLLNGAGITTAASTDVKAKTRLTVRNVGDASVFNIGTPVSRFTAKLVGDSTANVPSIDTLSISGDCAMDLVTGALGTATVGKLINARWDFSGDVKSIILKQMIDSRIYAGGVDSAVTGLPTSFSGLGSIKKLTISGTRSDPVGFSNSFIAAPTLGTVSIRKAVTDNGGTAFGTASNTLKSITIRDASQTILRWNDRQDPSLLAPQEDLVVSLI